MSEQRVMPEVLPGDLVTRPGLYEARCGHIVRITGWRDGWWVAEWNGIRTEYSSDGRQRYNEGQEPNQWQLLHWVGPLPASEPEPETTTEQLAEIEGQAEQPPQPQPIQVREGLWRQADGGAVVVRPTSDSPGNSWKRDRGYVWSDGARLYLDNGRHSEHETTEYDLVEYLGPIQRQAEPEPVPIQVREGRWKTRAGEIVSVTAMPTDHDDFSDAYSWWDGDVTTWADNGVFFNGYTAGKDLVEYLGPIEPQPVPQPQPESDAEIRVKLLKHANDTQATTIGQLQTEARDLNMEIGGLQRRLSERDARIRDLETIYSAATKSFEDANKANDALRAQVRILQQEADKKNSRIEFLETLDAGNAVAICDYIAKVAKLQGLVDTARVQLETAATERDELRAAIDAADKQLDAKDAQIRDLRIELDAAQQVPQPVSDEERERIWDEATEAAGRQVVQWLRPLTLALNRQPDERFSRFMALTLSVLPDLLPELLGYAVEDEADCEE